MSVSYLHHNIERNLTTEDIEHLSNTNFKGWKLFMIRSMFRMEFNIHEPIPKKYTDRYIAEVERRKRQKKIKNATDSKKNSNPSLIKQVSVSLKSDDTRSQGTAAEEVDLDSKANKNIVIDKAEVEQVKNVQIKTKFWFD